MHILLVEDDQMAGSALADALRANHYIVELAIDGQIGLELAQTFEYDLLLLDLLLPKIDGITLCRTLRSQGLQTPILLLTARDSSTERVIGLDAGADDYMVKPYNLLELMARIRALVRRGNANSSSVLTWEKLSLDLSTSQAKYEETILRLTVKEYSILELFLLHPQRVFSRSVILDRLWDAADSPGEEVVTTHIKTIRQKLVAAGAAKDFIETQYGLGYRLNPLYQAAAESSGGAGGSEPELTGRSSGELTTQLPPPLSTRRTGQPPPLLPVSVPCSDSQYLSAPQHMSDSQQQVEVAMQALWQRFKDTFIAQVEQLQQAAIALTTSDTVAQASGKAASESQSKSQRESPDTSQSELTAEDQQTLRLIAHKLAGSLGVFGYAHGSVLARHIENLLMGESPLHLEQVSQFREWVTLLQQELNQPPLFSASAVAPTPPTPTPLILVIDDDRTLTEALQLEATRWNFRLAVADHPAAAHQLIDRTPPDAILLDLTFTESPLECPPKSSSESNATQSAQVKRSDGLNFLRQLAQTRSPIPVVVFTGRNQLSDRVEVVRLGARAFLQKPVASDRVFQTLQAVLHPQSSTEGKVLVVDDDAAILAIVKNLLEPWGLQIGVLADPQQFWTVLENFVPDLLILDIAMPTFNGIELCQVVRSDPYWGSLPILFLTAHTDESLIQAAFAAGANDYIRKPIVASELVTRIISRFDRLRLQLKPQLTLGGKR